MNREPRRTGASAGTFTSPTLVSATICAYLKKSTKELILTQEDCELFCRLTKSFSDAQLGELLEDVVSKLPAGNRDYNLLAIERIMPELITSTRAKTLDTLALVQKSEQTRGMRQSVKPKDRSKVRLMSDL